MLSDGSVAGACTVFLSNFSLHRWHRINLTTCCRPRATAGGPTPALLQSPSVAEATGSRLVSLAAALATGGTIRRRVIGGSVTSDAPTRTVCPGSSWTATACRSGPGGAPQTPTAVRHLEPGQPFSSASADVPRVAAANPGSSIVGSPATDWLVTDMTIDLVSLACFILLLYDCLMAWCTCCSTGVEPRLLVTGDPGCGDWSATVPSDDRVPRCGVLGECACGEQVGERERGVRQGAAGGSSFEASSSRKTNPDAVSLSGRTA